MTKDSLADCSLEISLWDYEKNQGSYFLGGVRCNLGTGHYQATLQASLGKLISLMF